MTIPNSDAAPKLSSLAYAGAALLFMAANLMNPANAAQVASKPHAVSTATASTRLQDILSAGPVKALVELGNNEFAIYDPDTEDLIAYMATYEDKDFTLNMIDSTSTQRLAHNAISSTASWQPLLKSGSPSFTARTSNSHSATAAVPLFNSLWLLLTSLRMIRKQYLSEPS